MGNLVFSPFSEQWMRSGKKYTNKCEYYAIQIFNSEKVLSRFFGHNIIVNSSYFVLISFLLDSNPFKEKKC